jgi:translation initiation factor IF-2
VPVGPLATAQVKEEEQEAAKMDAVFPCILKIMPTCIFNKKDPIVLGVEVVEGIAKVRTRCARCGCIVCGSRHWRSRRPALQRPPSGA